MKKYTTTFLFIIYWGWCGMAVAQVDSSATGSTKIDSIQIDSATVDTIKTDTAQTNSLKPDSVRMDTIKYYSDMVDKSVLVPVSQEQALNYLEQRSYQPKPLFKVIPWQFHAPVGADTAATDSSLRWQYWPDWTYKLNREPGVISFRMGNSDRSNAVQRYAHGPNDQQLYWEDIPLNDPVSGTLRWSLLPKYKIGNVYEQDFGVKHRTTYYLRQYYLNRALSRLIYSEGKFDNRNLEFEVSHNLTQKTNVEVSYRDRTSGGDYDNSNTSGQQIFLKVSHHLAHNKYLKVNYINTRYDIGRPFGYQAADLRNFSFDIFRATPLESRTSSKYVSSLFAVNYYERKPDSLQQIDNFHAGFFYKGTGRSIEYSADSTSYRANALGLHAKKWWEWGPLQLQTGGSYQYFLNQTTKNLNTSNWSLLKAEGALQLDVGSVLDLNGNAGLQLRGDGFQGYRIGASANFNIGKLTFKPGLSSGSILPTPQQLYWQSRQYSGNTRLSNTHVEEVSGMISYALNPNWNVGLKGQYKDISDDIMVRQDSSFINEPSYASQAASIYTNWEPVHWEFQGSASIQQFTKSYLKPVQKVPVSAGKRVWLSGSAYWKGDILSKAAYLKAGLSGMLSPFSYQADHYNPALDFWQPASSDQPLPYYSRLDVDISARIRWIMLSLRWENVLDGVSQLGYFETARYPMTQRRFIFSVKAWIRN